MKLTNFLPLSLLLPLTSAWGGGGGGGHHASSSNSKKILLSDVASLTLRSSARTSHRRVPSIPQLKCISPASICSLHTIEVMRCTNAGSGYDDQDIQWTCKATLPEELKLGQTNVICEGYSGPDDPYILKGSCGVEYTMYLTDKGRERHPGIDDGWAGGRDAWTWGGVLFAMLFIGVLGWIVYSACVAGRENMGEPRPDRPRRVIGGGGGFWGGGGGGGGPGGWGPGWGPGAGNNDPPPPYPGTQPKPQDGQQQQWRPGFWSGVAGGAAAGYLAGQRGNQQRGPWGGDRDRYEWGGGHRNYGSTWGGSHGHRSGSRSSEGSSTGATHESTGFGSTSRR